jgi:Uma2 family endonuclease
VTRVDPAVRNFRGRSDLAVEDLESLPDEIRCELWDSRLVVLPHELTVHQVHMRVLASAFDVNCPEDSIACLSMPMEIDRHNVLRPDLVLLRASGAWRGPVLVEDVFLVGEVISPSSRARDHGAKMKRCAAAGIAAYWILDALGERATLSVFRLDGDGRYRRTTETAELVTIDEPWKVTLDLPAWTRRRDRLRAAARPDN